MENQQMDNLGLSGILKGLDELLGSEKKDLYLEYYIQKARKTIEEAISKSQLTSSGRNISEENLRQFSFEMMMVIGEIYDYTKQFEIDFQAELARAQIENPNNTGMAIVTALGAVNEKLLGLRTQQYKH